MLDAAARAGCRRLVLTSSIATLGWVPEGQVGDETAAFKDFLGEIGYDYTEETGNPAYQLFLS